MGDAQSVHETVDRLEPGPARRLAGLFDLDRELNLESTLPPLWHWAYFLDEYPQRELGPDGHPQAGFPAPPGPGMRRMFAGGRVIFDRPTRFGIESTRRVRVIREETKIGRSGTLTFATIQVVVTQSGEPTISEEQDVVYLPMHAAEPRVSPPDPPAAEEVLAFSLVVDPRVLFRFSALTYNAHRIHYDLAYANAEGHPDLVVHGPLQALMLIEAAQRARPGRGPLASFAYRLRAPAWGAGELSAYITRPAEFTLRDSAGRITASATARW
jgi:3-methylfumaryl-CoA hydratase